MVVVVVVVVVVVCACVRVREDDFSRGPGQGHVHTGLGDKSCQAAVQHGLTSDDSHLPSFMHFLLRNCLSAVFPIFFCFWEDFAASLTFDRTSNQLNELDTDSAAFRKGFAPPADRT